MARDKPTTHQENSPSARVISFILPLRGVSVISLNLSSFRFHILPDGYFIRLRRKESGSFKDRPAIYIFIQTLRTFKIR